MTNPTPDDDLVQLRWRTLNGSAAGQSSTLMPRAEAHRHLAGLNADQAKWCHWWFVLAPVTEWTADPGAAETMTVGAVLGSGRR